MQMLEEELSLTQVKPDGLVEVEKQTQQTEIIKQAIQKTRKKSILEIIIQKYKDRHKPATWDEVQQLKLERLKATLKRDIAKANSEAKTYKGGFFGGNKNKTSHSKEPKTKTKIFSSGPVEADGGLRKMIGTNDKNKYKDLIG